MNFDKSNQLLEAAKKVTPHGTHSWARIPPLTDRFEGRPEMPQMKYPKFISRASGAHLYDVDENDFVDYCMALGPVILGHAYPKVNDAVKTQMDSGVIYGLDHESEIELSKLLVKHVPCAEMVNLVVSGSDATAAALRIARAYTGKQKVVKFSGHYHSWHDWNRFDSILPSQLESSGIAKSAGHEIITLPWNDPDPVERLLKTRGDEIAAVICETLLGNWGCIAPKPGYLSLLRELTESENVLLIFDEVVTGFRVGIGGGQKMYGVTPDLATYAKAMANGFPIAAVAGKEEVMRVKSMIGGTYNSNPVSTAAAIATIRELENESNYSSMAKRGERVIAGIRDAARDARIECVVQGVPTLFSIIFGTNEPVTRPEQISETPFDPHVRRCAAFYQGMINRGVFNSPPGRHSRWCLSASHAGEEVDKTIEAAVGSMKDAAKI